MLSHHRIILFHLKLLRRGALILGSGVKMTGSGTGNELDLITHGIGSLNLFTAGTQLGQHSVYAFLIDNPHPFGR
jgi:hypothetical protein